MLIVALAALSLSALAQQNPAAPTPPKAGPGAGAKITPEEQAKIILQKFDADKDGKLSESEIVELVKDQRQKIQQRQQGQQTRQGSQGQHSQQGQQGQQPHQGQRARQAQ